MSISLTTASMMGTLLISAPIPTTKTEPPGFVAYFYKYNNKKKFKYY